MAYRTKVYSQIYEKYINPVMKFIGLTIDRSTEVPLFAWVGDNVDEVYDHIAHKVVKKGTPNWFVNDKKDPPRIYATLESTEQYEFYRKHNERYEYFNPIAKWMNTQLLLLLMIPNIYERYCKTSDNDDIDDYIDELIYDRVAVTQEELLKAINIKYFPVEMDPETGLKIYHYEININRDNGEENTIVARSTNRAVCIFMLMIKILTMIDDVFDSDEFDNIQKELEEDIVRYVKERDLNKRDAILAEKERKKSDLGITIEYEDDPFGIDSEEDEETEHEMQTVSDFADQVYDSTDSSVDPVQNAVNQELDKTNRNPVDITDMYKDSIVFNPADEPDIQYDLY